MVDDGRAAAAGVPPHAARPRRPCRAARRVDELCSRGRGGARVNGLRVELARVGIRGRLARRIVLELDDHLRCDPKPTSALRVTSRSGSQRSFACPHAPCGIPGFGALALAAVAIFASARGGGPMVPGARGWIESFGGLGSSSPGRSRSSRACSHCGGRHGRRGRPRSYGWCSANRRRARRGRRRADAHAVAGDCRAAVHVDAVVCAPPCRRRPCRRSLLACGASGCRRDRAHPPSSPSAGRSVELVIAIGGAAVTVMVVGSAFAEHSWVEGLSRGCLESSASRSASRSSAAGWAFAADALVTGAVTVYTSPRERSSERRVPGLAGVDRADCPCLRRADLPGRPRRIRHPWRRKARRPEELRSAPRAR